ncbi:MAG TPA: class I SAM-dependent methyltransferase [Acidimicrobiales bacterium]|nr:class I SAM-dependent methyltransferase [Acidimicrobiales bacterium]
MADALFEERRLVAVHDALEADRGDLDAYVRSADELGARAVLDIGCGTGTFACLLAGRNPSMTALDPAGASLELARDKPHAGAVRWLHSDAAHLPALMVAMALDATVDMATMTGNVAQVFLTDDDWVATLQGAHGALRPGGSLVFETRDPAREGWREWTRDQSYRSLCMPGSGEIETWVELTEVRLPLVSFRTTVVFADDGAALTSDSTLRFRERGEVAESLQRAGFAVTEVRDAPDRPGRELVFVARRL